MRCIVQITCCSSVPSQRTNRDIVRIQNRDKEHLLSNLNILFTNVSEQEKNCCFTNSPQIVFKNDRVDKDEENVINKSSHSCIEEVVPCVLRFSCFPKLSLFYPECKLEKQHTLWLDRPSADSWTSVFSCFWPWQLRCLQGFVRNAPLLYTSQSFWRKASFYEYYDQSHATYLT